MFEALNTMDLLTSLSIPLAAIALAWVFHRLLVRLTKRITRKTRSTFAESVLPKTEKPIIVLILLAGLYLSALSLPWSSTGRPYLDKGPVLLLSMIGIYALTILFTSAISWYENRLKTQKESGLTGRILTWFRLLTLLLAGLSAILLTLAILEISTSPVTNWMGEHGGPILFIFILSMAIIIAVGRFTPRLIETTISRRGGESKSELKKRTETLSRVLVNLGQITIIVVAILTILSEFINITTVIAGLGVVGVAIGFGAQSFVKDILAGLFVILENHYRVGDVATLAGVTGVVEDINLRRTVLRDLHGTVHIVPNGEIRVASNLTKDWARVNLDVTVGYGEDLKHVIDVINRVGKELAEDPKWAPLILKPPQVLWVKNFGPSGIDIKILGDTKPASQWDVLGELRTRLKETFNAEGIEIPWPHTKVYFGNSPDSPPGATTGKK